MNRASFYQPYLDKVSRSFAFCIKELDSPYRDWVGLSYILCRLLDTIEDSHWPSKEEQLASFDTFLAFVQTRPSDTSVATWAQLFPENIPTHEAELLNAANIFFNDFHQLPKRTHAACKQSIVDMARGMRYCIAQQPHNHIRMQSLAETNQYCFFVAGVVGELLSQLFSQACSDLDVESTQLEQAFHFGLYLQKINILKDKASDELEGRFFIHDRRQVRLSIESNARQAMNFLLALPVDSGRQFRLFCGWSLFIGLASLPFIDKSYHEKKTLKISRTETLLLLTTVKKNIHDNNALEALFKRYLPTPTEMPLAPASSNPAWRNCYTGKLPTESFSRLGL